VSFLGEFSNRIATTAIAAGAFGLAALAGAATASASSIDDEFLTNIDAANITFESAKDAVQDPRIPRSGDRVDL
jgi:hypothetical protein